MAEKIRILIEADGQKYSAELDKAERKTRQFGGTAERSAAGVSQLSTAVRGAAGVLAGLGAVQATRQIIDASLASQRLERTLRVATGSTEAAVAETKFLREESERLGLEFRTVAREYASLAAAARGTELQGQATRDIFLGVSEAAVTLGLSAEESGGALTAIQQIISKGTVSAEELRGQLGERLPGAFQIAARSLGVTTAELDDMLRKGEVAAEDLLPALARELRQTFGDEAQRAANGLQAELNRLQNTLFEISSGGDVGDLTDSVGDLADALDDPRVQEGLRNLANGLITLTSWAARAGGAVANLATFLGEEIAADIHGPVDQIDRLNARIRTLRNELEGTTTVNALEFFGVVDPQGEKGKRAEALKEQLADMERQRQRLIDQERSDRLAQLGILQPDQAFSLLRPEGVDYPDPPGRNQDRDGGAAAEAAKQDAITRELRRGLQDRLDEVERATASEATLEQRRHRAAITTLETARMEQLLTDQEYNRLKQRLQAEHAQRLADIQQESVDQAGEATRSQAEQLDRLEQELGNIAFAARDAFGTFEDAVINAARTGKFQFRDMVESILADMARLAIQQNVTRPLYDALLPALGGLFGGGTLPGTPGGTAVNASSVPVAHTGGVLGADSFAMRSISDAAFAGARRYHSGGIAGDEVAMIGRRGEGVFTEAQMRALAPVNEVSQAPVTVNVYGGEGERPEVRQRQAPGGQGQIIDVMVGEISRDLRRNGPFARTMQNTYPNLQRSGARR